ncbi:hypothetical protein F5J12DRAFT_33425 [Pisolithus orientalis]|uniref:uncharacterized protein n=1 Tax=Pisolithus orientalis TaxID=936130 RepID=UPI0022255473|nr:uncharacterized protein F5J12DRAFT_33425 [Pisolithus orientalis]KAI6035615.1 hypothetical protein F5J12DRAFT_33425 [Pisolithus orientalis]
MQFALLLACVALVAAGGARGLVAIDRRQSPVDVPAACTSTCQNVVDEGNAGCPQSQCCTNTFITEYYNCFSCIGSNVPSFDYAPEQTALNQLWAACETAGYSLSPPPALPGQTAPTSGVDAASSSGKTTAKAASTSSKSFPTFSTITAPAAASTPTSATTTASGNATTSATSGAQPTSTGGATREVQVHAREILGLALIWAVHQVL